MADAAEQGADLAVFPEATQAQVRLGAAGRGRAAGRAVLLRTGRHGQADRGGAGGRRFRARPGRPGVQDRRGLRRSRRSGRVLPQAAPVRRVWPTRVRRGGAGIRPGHLHARRSAYRAGDLLRRAVRRVVSGRWRSPGPNCLCCPPRGPPGCSRRSTGSRWSGRAPSRTPVWVAAVGQVPDPGERPTRAATGIGRSMLVDPLGVVRADLGPGAGSDRRRGRRRPDRDRPGQPAQPRQPPGRRVRDAPRRYLIGDCQKTGCSAGRRGGETHAGQRAAGYREAGDGLGCPARSGPARRARRRAMTPRSATSIPPRPDGRGCCRRCRWR